MTNQARVDGQLVTVIVSDPWEFPDENEGRIAFAAQIIDSTNGKWLLRFRCPITYKGIVWNYAVPTTHFVGQKYFGETHYALLDQRHLEPARIYFLSDAQALDEEYRSLFERGNDCDGPAPPGVLGSLSMGIVAPLSEGEDAYKEPRWVPPLK